MELGKIITLLQEFSPQAVLRTGMPIYIQTHKRMLSGQVNFYPNCLYVGYVSELPELISDNSETSLICVEDISLPSSYKNYELLNLITIKNGNQPHEILNKIADIMIDEARIVSSMQILLDALYVNKGLQYLVDVAFTVFENPIFVNDTAYKILAMSKHISYVDNTLEEEKSLGYIHEQNLHEMRKDNIFRQLSMSSHPLYSRRKNNAPGWLFKIIEIQNVEIGLVALVETNRPFREFDFELLERFSKLVSIELEKNDFYRSNKGLMYSYFLADLISNRLSNSKLVNQRLSYLHWKLYLYFQVIFITNYNGNMNEQKINRIANEVHLVIPDCRWTVHHNNLVLMINRPNQNLLTEKETRLLHEFLDLNKLSAGMSNVFFSILDTGKHYQQAMRAAELGLYLNHKSGIYNYSDYAIAYMAKILSTRHDLSEFCLPAIEIIKEYDSNNSTNLLETLEKYLYFPDNPLAATEALHIHRNTLLYRINKIKDLTNLDLGNGDVRLNLQLYFKFMLYQKGYWGN